MFIEKRVIVRNRRGTVADIAGRIRGVWEIGAEDCRDRE
jgi:hypothetical protein